jgi:hypothetical protein
MHKAELIVPQPSSIEVKISVEKLKRYKSPSNDQISAEVIQTRGNTLRSEIQKFTNSVWNKEELPEQ